MCTPTLCTIAGIGLEEGAHTQLAHRQHRQKRRSDWSSYQARCWMINAGQGASGMSSPAFPMSAECEVSTTDHMSQVHPEWA